ncbi:putative FKBP12-associated protein 1 like protein [Blattamonas nauphoetae]|uniref:FKBP12-associated protein 1 like protein n=1 Tax=Blattamonas nauphoetae TaxID=2049346 RepID=A0ABQ9WT46_9EUKA|nr:putative FKBP12-associated protein 1 like protein [Blattamonas nauphoetae]
MTDQRREELVADLNNNSLFCSMYVNFIFDINSLLTSIVVRMELESMHPFGHAPTSGQAANFEPSKQSQIQPHLQNGNVPGATIPSNTSLAKTLVSVESDRTQSRTEKYCRIVVERFAAKSELKVANTHALFFAIQGHARLATNSTTRLNLSCGDTCGKRLDCGSHVCTEICHDGPCPRCSKTFEVVCQCGRHTKTVGCRDKDLPFICGEVCGKKLSCGHHTCQRICHADHCGECPSSVSAIVTCNCGKHTLSSLGITRSSCVDPIPECGEICGKKLPCGHLCKSKCHVGPCPACHESVLKSCVCGSTQASVLCSDPSPKCLKFCGALLSCGRHKCQETCCPYSNSSDENAHICMRICNRKLNCGNHTCQNLCHSGRCPRCLNSSFDAYVCPCGRTTMEPPIPCGATLPLCPFNCHRPRPCGHPAHHVCHSDDEPCAPCLVIVQKECAGGHGIKMSVPCSSNQPSCGQPCGKLLKCQHHTCRRICHGGDCQPHQAEGGEGSCGLVCGKKRKYCEHECTATCHPQSACDTSVPCPASIVVRCECGTMKETLPCSTCDAHQEAFKRQLPCGEECRRKKETIALGTSLHVPPSSLSLLLSPQSTTAPSPENVFLGYSEDLISRAKKERKTVQKVEFMIWEWARRVSIDLSTQIRDHLADASRAPVATPPPLPVPSAKSVAVAPVVVPANALPKPKARNSKFSYTPTQKQEIVETPSPPSPPHPLPSNTPSPSPASNVLSTHLALSSLPPARVTPLTLPAYTLTYNFSPRQLSQLVKESLFFFRVVFDEYKNDEFIRVKKTRAQRSRSPVNYASHTSSLRLMGKEGILKSVVKRLKERTLLLSRSHPEVSLRSLFEMLNTPTTILSILLPPFPLSAHLPPLPIRAIFGDIGEWTDIVPSPISIHPPLHPARFILLSNADGLSTAQIGQALLAFAGLYFISWVDNHSVYVVMHTPWLCEKVMASGVFRSLLPSIACWVGKEHFVASEWSEKRIGAAWWDSLEPEEAEEEPTEEMEAARSDMERRNIEGLTIWMDCVYGWTVTGDVGGADGELGDIARKFLWKEEEVSSSDDDEKKGEMLLTKEEKRERREKRELRRKMKESEELVRRQRRDEDSLFPRWLVGGAYLGAALVDEGKEESRPMLGEERVRRKKGKVDEMLIENKFSILTQSSKIAGPPTNEAELVQQGMEGWEEGSVQRMKERIEESSSSDEKAMTRNQKKREARRRRKKAQREEEEVERAKEIEAAMEAKRVAKKKEKLAAKMERYENKDKPKTIVGIDVDRMSTSHLTGVSIDDFL